MRAAAILAALAAPASAEPVWSDLIGTWRPADYASCGIDDVRYGRIVSVGRASLLLGQVSCVIRDGAKTEAGFALDGDCDLGGGYRARLAYDWRMVGPDEAVLTHEGFETRLLRCGEGVE